jgi:hypothetical protein
MTVLIPGTAVKSLTRIRLLALGVGIVGACHTEDSVAPQATVHFVIDAPLCSSRLPVQFFIDSLIRGGADLDLRGWMPGRSPREIARVLLAQMSLDADRRRVAELCGAS